MRQASGPASVSLKTSIAIAARPDAVFRYLEDVHYHLLWNPQIASVSPLGHLRIGSHYQTTGNFLGITIHAENEVIELEPNRRLTLKNLKGNVSYLVHYELHANAAGTTLHCLTEVWLQHNYVALPRPVLKVLARRELHADLHALKLAVEQKLE